VRAPRTTWPRPAPLGGSGAEKVIARVLGTVPSPASQAG